MTESIYVVRDDGYNLLAWSPDREDAERAAAEIDDGGRGRAVRVSEEQFDPERHGDAERYSPVGG